MADTYITDSTIKRGGEYIPPGQEIELTDEEAEPLLEDGAIRKPEVAGPPPASEPVIHPLAPQTIAEIKAVLPAVDEMDRLEAALEVEETKGGQEAIQGRIDELAAEDGE